MRMSSNAGQTHNANNGNGKRKTLYIWAIWKTLLGQPVKRVVFDSIKSLVLVLGLAVNVTVHQPDKWKHSVVCVSSPCLRPYVWPSPLLPVYLPLFFSIPLSLSLSPLLLVPPLSSAPGPKVSEPFGPLASPILGAKKEEKGETLQGWWVAWHWFETLLEQREKWGKYQWRWSHIAH